VEPNIEYILFKKILKVDWIILAPLFATL